MATSESSQPEDYAGLVDTQDKGRNYMFYIVIVVFLLVLVGYFSVDSPEQEIELEAPQSQGAIDPIIKAQIEAARQPVTTGKAEKQLVTEINSGSSPAELDLKSEPIASIADFASVAKASGDSKQTTTAANAGEAARSLINSIRQGEKNLTMDQLFGQATELQQQAMSTDSYLLYFYAARKGHGPSAFELAAMHDPAHFNAGSEMMDEPDPVQAYKWYSIAAERNVEGAEERLHTLRNSIEAAAADGDSSAQRLLLNWK